jgi:hypothetical protein
MTTDTTPEHSRLSPSKAHTWTECTASLAFVKANEHRLPPDRPGPSAMEGTKAHTVAEYLLLGKPAPAWASKDMLSHGKAYADFCHEIMGPKPGIISWGAEFRTPLYYLPSERGTVDFHAVTTTGVHLVDYKYGYDPVSSVENLQMAIYARSLIEHKFDGFWIDPPTDDLIVTMTIFQPRLDLDHTTWTLTWKELLAFTDERITPKAQSILRGDPGVFKCGPKICKWCRATAVDAEGVPVCPTYNDYLLSDFRDEVEAMIKSDDLPPVEQMEVSRAVQIFNSIDKLSSWIKEVEKFVNERLLSGKPLPGVKLVLSRGGHRYWLDKDAAAKLLRSLKIPKDELFTTELISPAKAEKLTDKMKGKKMIKLQQLIGKPSGKPMAVPESDPRPAYQNDPLNDFSEDDLS